AREGFGAERSTGAFNESAPVPRTFNLISAPCAWALRAQCSDGPRTAESIRGPRPKGLAAYLLVTGPRRSDVTERLRHDVAAALSGRRARWRVAGAGVSVPDVARRREHAAVHAGRDAGDREGAHGRGPRGRGLARAARERVSPAAPAGTRCVPAVRRDPSL